MHRLIDSTLNNSLYEEADVRAQLASEKNISLEAQKMLAMDKCLSVREALAGNQFAVPAILAKLAGDENTFVVQAVAKNPVTPSKMLELLTNHPSEQVRTALASNPVCPVECLTWLSSDEDVYVRQSAARNPRTVHADLLRLCLEDRSPLIKVGLSENPMLPLDIHHHLAAALSTGFGASHCKVKLTERDDAIPEYLTRWAEDSDEFVRRAVAGAPRTPVEVLEGLCMDKDEMVKVALFNNPSITPRILTVLAQDDALGLRKRAAAHEHTPVLLLFKMAQTEVGVIREPALKNLERRDDKSLLEAIAHEGIALSQPAVPGKKPLGEFLLESSQSGLYQRIQSLELGISASLLGRSVPCQEHAPLGRKSMLKM
ncbi:Leucine rich repeat variant [compost metagenome]